MKKMIVMLGVFLSTLSAYSQGALDYGSGIKIDINEDGSKYTRLILWNQFWIRNSQMNPGSMINEQPVTDSWNMGNRRLRMLAYSQISKRYLILLHFGINNQTFISGGASGTSGTGSYGSGKKPQIFFQDAWNEYALILPGEAGDFTLNVGAGLHYYMGLSRLTQAATLNFLTLDSPVFSWPLIDNSDQFARQLGIFAKGKYDRFEYRISANQPFATNLQPANFVNPDDAVAVDNNGNPKWSTAGYFEYQFLEKESNLLPYKIGTYLGYKKVFNLGAGFYHHPNGTKSSVNDVIRDHNISLFAVDAFADIPLGSAPHKGAVTGYASYFNYNFGPNYLRNIGIMNVAEPDPNFGGQQAIAGAGNSQPTIGTGNIFHAQAGFLLPSSIEKPRIRYQPFVAYTHKNFEALEHPSNQFDIGMNWHLDGHHAKISTQYSTRPLYADPSSKPTYKGEFILQLMIYL